jgi:multiple sugar transport system substrate-binding protein
MFDGKIYMLPTDVTGEVLIYNSELIPEPPKTWDEYLDVAKKFTKSITPDSPTDYGTAFGGRPSIASESWSIHLWSQGGDILDENNQVIVDSPTAIESFKWWVDAMRTQGIAPPDVTSWAYPEKNVALQEIRIPMASHFQAGLPVLNDCAQSPKVCGKMKLAPNPAGPAGSFTFVQTLGLLLNSQSKNKDAAADFAFWVVSPEGAKIFTEAGGTSPRISVFTDPEIAASRGAWWNDYAEALGSGHGTIRDPNASQLLEALNAQISAAYAGQISPEDALKQAAQDMREILGQ